MEDGSTVGSYGVTEEDFLVVMVVRGDSASVYTNGSSIDAYTRSIFYPY